MGSNGRGVHDARVDIGGEKRHWAGGQDTSSVCQVKWKEELFKSGMKLLPVFLFLLVLEGNFAALSFVLYGG